MKIFCRFDYYRLDDLAHIVQKQADRMGWRYEDPGIFRMMASRAKQTPRLALRHLESCYHVCRSENAAVITLAHVKRAFELSQVDARGLDHLEQRYLALLAEADSLPLNVLASRLGLPARTIQEVLEPYLILEGLIGKDGSRRVITDQGLKHIQGAA